MTEGRGKDVKRKRERREEGEKDARQIHIKEAELVENVPFLGRVPAHNPLPLTLMCKCKFS